MPPIGVELTERQKLACLHRILAGIGFNENMAGHVTMTADADGSLWASPWGLWWDEVHASDLCLVTPDGELRDGRWDVSPAIFVHTELHRTRSDARVVVHNHPYHATLLATLGRLPEITHQAACMFDGDLALVDEYQGQVLDQDAERVAGVPRRLSERGHPRQPRGAGDRLVRGRGDLSIGHVRSDVPAHD